MDYGKKNGFVDDECFNYTGDDTVPCPNIGHCARYKISDYCVASGVEGIKREIFKNGPVISMLPIYRDFLIYKDGIYKIIEGTARFQAGHIVKLIGWDQDENATQYWIIENSWGETWGMNGLGYVGIGQPELFLDEFAIAGTPEIETGKEEEFPEVTIPEEEKKEEEKEKEKEKEKEDESGDEFKKEENETATTNSSTDDNMNTKNPDDENLKPTVKEEKKHK